MLYAYINRHAGTPSKIKTKDTISLGTTILDGNISQIVISNIM